MRVPFAVAAALLLACTSHDAEVDGELLPSIDKPDVDLSALLVPLFAPRCKPLPDELPAKAVVQYTHDTSMLEYRTPDTPDSIDVAFVADAACPVETFPLESPRCIRLRPEDLQIMWTRLRELEVDRIVTEETEGDCIHCPRRWIGVTWPGAECWSGMGSSVDVVDESSDRFYSAARYLDAVARSLGD